MAYDNSANIVYRTEYNVKDSDGYYYHIDYNRYGEVINRWRDDKWREDDDDSSYSSGSTSATTGNGPSNTLISGTSDNDTITNNGGSNVTIQAGAGNDYVNNVAGDYDSKLVLGNRLVADLGDGDDTFVGGYAHFVSVYGGAGNDSVRMMGRGKDNYIDLGSGNDTFSSYGRNDAESFTIKGGTGDDNISLDSGEKNALIVYEVGDGDDTIYGFDDDDTLQIAGSYSTFSSGDNDVAFKVGDGSINLIGAAGKDLNILQTTPTSYTYTGGNQNVSSYAEGEKINYSTDFTGIGFNDTDFLLNSSSGSLTIQNARDKVIDVAVNGNTIAHAYLASGSESIDRSDCSTYEVIIGADNVSNTIKAGSSGSSLWGGLGGNDFLRGGAGVDNFFYGKNDGFDRIYSSSAEDVINLYDISLADIKLFYCDDYLNGGGFVGIYLDNNTNVGLETDFSEHLSPTFKLADGSAWQYNTTSGEWQSA